MAAKKQLTAAQGMDAACILFELNSKREHIVNLAFGAEIPEACLTEPGALPDFCAEWRAFVHATVTAGLMQHAPNSVLVGYLRRTGELLAATAKAEGASLHTQAVPVSEDSLNAFVDGPFAAYMPLLAQEKQHQCPVLFCRRLGYDEDSRITPEILKKIQARLAAVMALVITAIRASMGMYLLCKAIHEQTDVRVLLTGEISDELFGYKYTDYAPTADAFQQESQKRIRELYMYDVLRADRCISSNSIEARVPFGDLDFVRYVMAIDPEKKLNSYGKGKYLLRKAFEGDWLPPEILWREKAAFSDAVGHSMVDDIKEYAESLYTDEEFQLRRANYSAHCMPFTKESLFYREIFEKYYHDQSRTIVGFWMPNKAWPNCNVNDPSARVLANYGASGV